MVKSRLECWLSPMFLCSGIWNRIKPGKLKRKGRSALEGKGVAKVPFPPGDSVLKTVLQEKFSFIIRISESEIEGNKF